MTGSKTFQFLRAWAIFTFVAIEIKPDLKVALINEIVF